MKDAGAGAGACLSVIAAKAESGVRQPWLDSFIKCAGTTVTTVHNRTSITTEMMSVRSFTAGIRKGRASKRRPCAR